MDKPILTVLMPVYNTPEEFLKQAIESILNQTFKDFIFLIIDDGSKPFVKKIIDTYQDKRIYYIRNEKNLGLIQTLNKGLDLAKTKYIVRMDSDDIACPERLKKQIDYMEKNPDISILGTGVEFFPEYKIWQPVQFPKYTDYVQGCPIAHPTVMIRLADLKKYNLRYDDNYPHAEDYALWVKAHALIKIENLQSVCLKYRWHENNVSNTSKDIQQETVLKIQNELKEKLGLKQMVETKKMVKRFCGLPLVKIILKNNKCSLYLFGIIKILSIKEKK